MISRGIELRDSRSEDLASLERLYPDAFPEEALLPLVRALLQLDPPPLSIVAARGEACVGHIVFTRCGLGDGPLNAALLGPLAVASAAQKQGLGTALIRSGLDRLERDGVRQVFVLGDPGYYGRFGFRPEASVAPPYRLPDAWREAWQSLDLNRDAAPPGGALTLPDPWMRPELWQP